HAPASVTNSGRVPAISSALRTIPAAACAAARGDDGTMTTLAGSATQRPSDWLNDERRLGVLLLSPAVVYIAALVGFPFLLAVLYSVSDATVGSTAFHFVGLRNFQAIVHDPTFWRSMQNAIVFTIASQVLVV